MKKFRCEFASWPTLKLPLIKWRLMHTHTYLRWPAWPARRNISKCRDVPLPEFCFVSFPVNIRFSNPPTLQASFTAKCHLLPVIKLLLDSWFGIYQYTHLKKNFEALPKTYCRIIQRAINTIDIFGSLIWLIEGQWPNWRWMDRIPGRYQEGLHFSFTQTFAWDDNFLKSLKKCIFVVHFEVKSSVKGNCGGVSEVYYKL